MMLLRTDPSRHRLTYLSIPRDLRASIPGYGQQKINAAMQLGGPKLAVQTADQLFGPGLQVNHVVVVDFGAFVQLIDAVGGIDVNVPENILSNRFDCPYSTSTRCSQWQGWRFHKGVQHMDGHRALIYSRIRENQLDRRDTDITRGQHQQDVMQATLSKLASPGTFFRLPFSGGSLMKPLATDLSTWQFIQLAWVKFRAGSTLHCRLGGKDYGDGFITGDQENIAVIQMVLGKSRSSKSRSSMNRPSTSRLWTSRFSTRSRPRNRRPSSRTSPCRNRSSRSPSPCSGSRSGRARARAEPPRRRRTSRAPARSSTESARRCARSDSGTRRSARDYEASNGVSQSFARSSASISSR
jgi:LCP family protein required for cell wall assembly